MLASLRAGRAPVDPVEAEAAMAEAKGLPEHAWYDFRSVLVAIGAALLPGDTAAVDAALAPATHRWPIDTAELRVLAARALGGPHRPTWLREALKAYEGAGATLEADRVRQALRDAGGAVPRRRRAQPVPPALSAAGVTARESEVLAMVASGLPNREIAERLYVSVRTVESHVSSLLGKVGARNRADLAGRAASMATNEAAPTTA